MEDDLKAEETQKPDSTEPVPAYPPSPSTSSFSAYPSTSDRLRAFQNSALHFLSNASNETLGACAAGLAASTYLVLGRIGLVLIGAVGGIVLHANWEAQGRPDAADGSNAAQESQRRRRELGVEVVKRALDWRDIKTHGSEADDSDEAHAKSGTLTDSKALNFSEFQPETQAALTNFTDAVIRDYVRWWYSPLLPTEQSFPAACRQTLTRFIITFSNHLSRKRAADPVLDFLANSTAIILVFLQELASAMKASQRQDPQDAIRTYLQYQPDSSLANVLSHEQQEKKLAYVADDILQNFLDGPSYNCPPVKAFLREVLAGLILQPMITGQSKADSINGWIVYLLEDGEPELMNVIDAGVEDMTGKSSINPPKQQGQHQRRVSRADEALEQAMKEAERLNAMIAEEEAKRRQGIDTLEADDVASSTATEAGLATPTSSDSDRNRGHERARSTSFMFDAEGNAIQSATPSPMKEPTALVPASELTESEENLVLQPTDVPPAPTEMMVAIPLTLHNAFISMIDMGEGDDRASMKREPQDNFLVQIEPASSRFPGWMITRRYADFVKLHEKLLILARISGVPQFTQLQSELPSWRGIPRRTLRSDLELYLRNTLKYDPLAESEAMKKFLEKETGIAKAPAQNKNVLVQGGAALENVGKNFINVLGQGGKGIAGGGKAVLGGVQGVFGAVTTGVGGPKKPVTPQRLVQTTPRSNTASVVTTSRLSQEVPRSSADTEGGNRPLLPPRLPGMSLDHNLHAWSGEESPARQSEESLHLPPPPSAISDEYSPVFTATPPKLSSRSDSPDPHTPTSSILPTADSPSASKILNPPQKPQRQNAPITEEETRVSIELIFAIITELYSLSSAWTIRLSLLSAAKTFLLRPQNPQLESIRILLQESVLEANFSDKGLATHINKLRENSAPTDEERAKWPKELTPEESKKLRSKARKLLVERGMPQALTSVMGQQASGEALGRIFDCLQIEEVAKGLIFALLLQALRAATQ